jgi:tRNA A37 methylthiotransferase MiaB
MKPVMANPLIFDSQRVLANVRRADTQDLLNRATAYRAGMEPEALQIIERELYDRGIGSQEIEEHWSRLGEVIYLEDGCAASCSFCRLPAVAQGWGWHRLRGVLPLFPRLFYYCKVHR